ncbi:MAG: hypothetical protein Tsb008_17350 [Rhodothalassiaceae bacterium]
MTPGLQIPLSIAAGGALGALSRHYISSVVSRASGLGAPIGILAVNVAGSFLMGLLVGLLALKIEMPQAVRAFLTIGFLGGFTTFSSFSLDAALMIEQQLWGRAALYVLLSVALSVGGLYLGLALARHLP